jgi:hypothetical protein
MIFRPSSNVPATSALTLTLMLCLCCFIAPLVQQVAAFGNLPTTLSRRQVRAVVQSSNTVLFAASGAKAAEDEAVQLFKDKFSVKRKTRPIDDKLLRKTFKELSKVYGLENASKICKTELVVLEMNSLYFKGTFDCFVETFGEEGAIGMVRRNPGLLATSPVGFGSAATAGPETMALSYVVAATRPLGPYLLGLLFALLLTPTLESVTGLSISPFKH